VTFLTAKVSKNPHWDCYLSFICSQICYDVTILHDYERYLLSASTFSPYLCTQKMRKVWTFGVSLSDLVCDNLRIDETSVNTIFRQRQPWGITAHTAFLMMSLHLFTPYSLLAKVAVWSEKSQQRCFLVFPTMSTRHLPVATAGPQHLQQHLCGCKVNK
jgi:hypothetical protein